MSHLRNVAKNTFYGYVYILTIKIVQFALRTVFIYTLGVVYLGVNGLFTNILGILSFAELGIGGIINTSLYKPLASNDRDKIVTYINIYKKAYHTISLVILVFGLAIIPFLDFLVKDPGNIGNIKIYYIIYLFNTVISYFATYYYSIPRGEEKGYLISRINAFFTLVIGIVQIIILLTTQNFYLFLISQSIIIIIEKIYIYIKIKRLYPWAFVSNKTNQLTSIEKKTLISNTKAAVISKVLQTSISFTDNIIISIFLGLSTIGYASNYVMISNTFYTLSSQVFDNLTASVGHIINTRVKSESNKIFDVTMLSSYLIYGLVSIFFIVLVNSFIFLWIGNSYVLGNRIAIIFGFILFTSGLRTAYYSYKNAFAIFYDDYYYGLYATIINIVSSIFLAKYLGLEGVFLGTLITEIFLLFVKSSVSYKRITGNDLIYFFKMLVGYYVCYVVCLSVCFKLSYIILKQINIINFILMVIIIFVCFIVLNYVFYFNTRSFKTLFNLVITRIPIFNKKGKK